MSNTVVLQVFGCFRRSLLQLCKVYQNPPGARWITAVMILVSLFFFQHVSSTFLNINKKSHQIHQGETHFRPGHSSTCYYSTTATTTITTHTAWLATSWTQVVTHALERGTVERSCCDPWISKQFGKGLGGERFFGWLLVSFLQLGRVGRWILDDFVGIPIGFRFGIFTPTLNGKNQLNVGKYSIHGFYGIIFEGTSGSMILVLEGKRYCKSGIYLELGACIYCI